MRTRVLLSLHCCNRGNCSLGNKGAEEGLAAESNERIHDEGTEQISKVQLVKHDQDITWIYSLIKCGCSPHA